MERIEEDVFFISEAKVGEKSPLFSSKAYISKTNTFEEVSLKTNFKNDK